MSLEIQEKIDPKAISDKWFDILTYYYTKSRGNAARLAWYDKPDIKSFFLEFVLYTEEIDPSIRVELQNSCIDLSILIQSGLLSYTHLQNSPINTYFMRDTAVAVKKLIAQSAVWVLSPYEGVGIPKELLI